MEKKSIRIGILAYCITQSSPRYKNCSEVRKMFKSGAALYQKEIATKDINDLKVTTYLVLLYILNRLCCPIWCHTSSQYLITGERCYFLPSLAWDNRKILSFQDWNPTSGHRLHHSDYGEQSHH